MTRDIQITLRDQFGVINCFRRPRITICIDREPYNPGCIICLNIAEQMGQPNRYIELKEPEARQLAAHLLTLADLSWADEAA